RSSGFASSATRRRRSGCSWATSARSVCTSAPGGAARTPSRRTTSAGRPSPRSGTGARSATPREAHPLVHLLERRRRGLARLLGALREQPLELARVGHQLLVAQAHRLEQRDDRLADVLLERAVALAVVAGLDRRGILAIRDGHDLDQVRDPGLVR